MNVRFLAIAVSLLLLVLIVELVRRERLTFKYAAGWIFVALGGLGLAVFDRILADVAARLGFQLASNFIFFSVLCAFVFLSLLLTIFLCQQNARNDRMAQRIGLLEYEVEELKKRRE